jgi:N-acetylglutamate synthase-like GNAT family acetyltransferase
MGGLVAERDGDAAMIAGPVVVADATAAVGVDGLEVAAQLVAAALDHARALGIRTVYARPQGLDRIWVRFGFIPLPESTLPPGLAGRPGAGLFAWRGGSALWTLRESS